MTQNTGQAQSLDVAPAPHEVHEVGHAVKGKRWNGSTWELAGAEGVASVPEPRQHDDAPVVVDLPK
jgi:hypothetical protein